MLHAAPELPAIISTMKTKSVTALLLLLGCGLAASARAWAAEPAPTSGTAGNLTDADRADLVRFDRDAAAAKESGGTRLAITTGLPPSLWQFDPPDDPYPGWFVHQPSILKIFPPQELQPFVSLDYAARAVKILEERCKILRKYGLKGAWNSNEPQVLPEAFFAAYPRLRGPRVDQPNRSRVPRFAPCVDEPETLRLYRDALKTLWAHCPEVDSFSFLTTDSGSGFCWVPGLYPGINGNSNCKERPMEDRVAGFLMNFQEVGRGAGVATVMVNINPISPRQWMTPSFSPEVLAAIMRKLPAGLAVSGREGPDGRPFSGARAGGNGGNGGAGAFYPIVGLPSAPARGGGGRGGRGGGSVSVQIERLTAERKAAAAQVGDELADDVVTVWSSLDDATARLAALDFGGMLRFGHVLARWIDRPMVPFPAELQPDEKDYYYRHLFQAKGEEQADDLVDIQAMREYEGWGAKLLFQRVIELTAPSVRSAIAAARRVAAGTKDEKVRATWNVHVIRIEVLLCLLQSADNMVGYQAQLDRVRALELKPEVNPPLGVQSSWDRTDMMETARKEIDNAVRLRELLTSTTEPLLDLAPTPEEEYVMRLGPDLPAQLKRKIDVMNAHWRDYDRIFTVPNP
jgi:hypothetical protein